MTLYLDANATTPLDPRVCREMVRCFEEEVGNAGSPHEFGERAKKRVHHARDQIASCVNARRHEVIFTSGATESNNLAILGLAPFGEQSGKRHIISTRIEHKSVLEPLQKLADSGFEVTFVSPDRSGRIAAEELLSAIRPDTLLVSVMQVNNETGIRQPIEEIAEGLRGSSVLFHVDAAQGFGKENDALRHDRIDLISLSGHKLHGPMGIGALIIRRRQGGLAPLSPLMYGGGQELGLRPGTLPVPLIVGFGLAAELAHQERLQRMESCRERRDLLLDRLSPLSPVIHGDLNLALPNTLNLSFPGWDADQVIEALRGIAAVSDGAACTSVCATASHVLSAMGVSAETLDGAVRFSWSHMTPLEDLQRAAELICTRLAPQSVSTRS